jgi:hypothetical protein
MEQYEKDVINARKNKLNQRFANSLIEHAKILTKEIILDANKKVSILSDSFNEFFYSKLEENIVNFLKKDNENIIELIVSDKQKQNKLIKELQTKFPTQFKVRFISEDKFPTDNDTKEKVNYIVNDNNAFRYEYSDKNIQHGVVNAIANFNHSQDSKILTDMFEKIKQVS